MAVLVLDEHVGFFSSNDSFVEKIPIRRMEASKKEY